MRLKGRDAVGTVRSVVAVRNWARVDWDIAGRWPVIVHLYELELEPAVEDSSPPDSAEVERHG